MSGSDPAARAVAHLSRQESKLSLLGLLRGRKRKGPELREGFDTYLVMCLPDGSTELRALLPTDARTGPATGAEASIASVNTQPSPLEVPFAAVVSDGVHDWDLVFRGSWWVERSRPFLTRYALGILSPGMSLGKEIVESWLANTVRHHVRDALGGFSIEDLRDKDALPASWWEKHLCGWLDECGIAVKITEARWESASAARAEEERRRQEDMARVEQERERERQAKLRETEAEENYKREKARIDHDSRLSEAERDHQLQVLELRYRKELLAAEAEVEDARHACEAAALGHEVNMARLRNKEEERRRQEDMARVEQERERERQAKLRETETEANYKREKARIDHDSRLSDAEREHQLQILELQYRKELLAIEAEVEDACEARETAALRHEVNMARLRNELEGLKEAKARENEAEREHREALGRLESAQELLERLARLGEPLLQQLADRDSRTAHQAAERLASPEFGVSPQQLADLGYPTTQQALVEHFREKASVDKQAVVLRKAELVTRDVGTAKVKGLPINSSLHFEAMTKRAGYVTLLNIGTSGAVYMHIPNAYVGVEQARVAAGRAYAVPGPELLPREQLNRRGLDYVEIGPPGWEHMAVIVSDKPLTDANLLSRASSEAPFVTLAEGEFEALCVRLGGFEDDAWSAGVLSFLVG